MQSTNVGPAYRRYNLDDKYFQPPFLPPFYTAYLEVRLTVCLFELQISVASTVKIPDYRKYMAGYLFTVPYEVPFYTAYVEVLEHICKTNSLFRVEIENMFKIIEMQFYANELPFRTDHLMTVRIILLSNCVIH